MWNGVRHLAVFRPNVHFGNGYIVTAHAFTASGTIAIPGEMDFLDFKTLGCGHTVEESISAQNDVAERVGQIAVERGPCQAYSTAGESGSSPEKHSVSAPWLLAPTERTLHYPAELPCISPRQQLDQMIFVDKMTGMRGATCHDGLAIVLLRPPSAACADAVDPDVVEFADFDWLSPQPCPLGESYQEHANIEKSTWAPAEAMLPSTFKPTEPVSLVKQKSRNSILADLEPVGVLQSWQNFALSGGSQPRKKRLLPDVSQLKRTTREAITNPSRERTRFYKESGVCQAVARHRCFDYMTFMVLGAYAVWLAMDVDSDSSCGQGDGFTVLVDCGFCFCYIVELVIRVGAFKTLSDSFRDCWLVFDANMVLLALVDAGLPLAFMITWGETCQSTSVALRILNIVRTLRLLRLARLFSAFRELHVLMKGISEGFRGVCSTLFLLLICLYFLATLLKLATFGTKTEDSYSTVLSCMHNLLLVGVFWNDLEGTLDQVKAQDDSFVIILCIYLSIFVGSLLIMNLLIGVLCEVAVATRAVDIEESRLKSFSKELAKILLNTSIQLDSEGDMLITEADFYALLLDTQFVYCLVQHEVNALAVSEQSRMLFRDDQGFAKVLKFHELLDLLLSFSIHQNLTVQDTARLKKNVSGVFKPLISKITEVKTKQQAIDVEINAQVVAMNFMLKSFRAEQNDSAPSAQTNSGSACGVLRAHCCSSSSLAQSSSTELAMSECLVKLWAI
eukprot:TRINITY_DN33572_c0_g1_i1.p1 TRINITY_DN33572_c0_g1~~TRINITY_DN33572_c0_g1_i1.p1  ORF type:complete len:734 (+),score=109.91 TRINITY_DN33572_c0_g1_i1:33-2234(+)